MPNDSIKVKGLQKAYKKLHVLKYLDFKAFGDQ